MYTYNYNTNHEERRAWRSAHEIKLAALEHEKWRIIMMEETTASCKSQVGSRDGQQPVWLAVFKAPLRLFANLMG